MHTDQGGNHTYPQSKSEPKNKHSQNSINDISPKQSDPKQKNESQNPKEHFKNKCCPHREVVGILKQLYFFVLSTKSFPPNNNLITISHVNTPLCKVESDI